MLKSHYIFVNIYFYSFEEPVLNDENGATKLVVTPFNVIYNDYSSWR